MYFVADPHCSLDWIFLTQTIYTTLPGMLKISKKIEDLIFNINVTVIQVYLLNSINLNLI